MKITEKQLLDGFWCLNDGLDNVSRVRGVEIHWVYRQEQADCCPRRERDNATLITLEKDRCARIELDLSIQDDHPAVLKMQRLRNEAYGNQVS